MSSTTPVQSPISSAGYGFGAGGTFSPLRPIISNRDPTAYDVNYDVGIEWVNKTSSNVWFLASVSSIGGTQQATWQEMTYSGGAGSFTTLTNTLAYTLGTAQAANNSTIGSGQTSGTIIVGGSTATGAITVGQSTAAQTINIESAASNTGAQVVNILSGATPGANTTLNIMGGAGTAGTQTFNLLASGATRAGAVNIGTGAAAHVITVGSSSAGAISADTAAGISLDAATASNFTVTGAGADLTLASAGGSVAISSTENAASAIGITANGGTSETIVVTASQGTGAASIDLVSTAGGITLDGGLGSASAINVTASDTAGGMTVSAGTGGIAVDTTGALSLDSTAASNLTVTGASLDLTVSSVGGSVNVTASEAVADAIAISASDAAGGVTITAGTGNINMDSIDVIQSISSAGNDLTYQVTNSDNTNAASRAGVELATGGTSSGDPYINFLVSGAGVYTLGIDNSDSDNFKLSASAALGTTDIVTISSAGAVTSAAGITATTGDITASAGGFVATLGSSDVATTSRAQSFIADGDEGTGVASTVMYTNVVDETVSTGAGTVLMKTANPGNSSGWLKIYNGTSVRYIPYWTNISP